MAENREERTSAEVKKAAGTEVKKPTQKLTIRHILVIVAGILICFAPSALVFNAWSIFTVPVTESMGVSTSQFSVMPTIIYLGAAIFAPFAGNLMEKYDLRIVMSLSVAACGFGLIGCSFYTEIWQFYISGLLEGFGVVSLICMGPATLVNRWYGSHIGLCVGICVAMAGLGGATWSMVDGFILASADYHAAYLFNGIAALVLGLPATLLCIRSHPYEVGLLPYGVELDAAEAAGAEGVGLAEGVAKGAEAKGAEVASTSEKPEGEKQWGVAAKLAFAMPAFYLLALAIGLVNGTAAAAGNLLPTYLYHLSDIGAAGLTAATVVIMASVVASCVQVSQMLAKIYLGAIADRNIIVAVCLTCTATFIGVILCWQGYLVSEMSVYVGAFLFGLFYGTTNVLGPTITRYIFGQREYTKIYSRITIVVNIVPAIFVTLFAFLSEISWALMFTVTLVMVATVFVLFMMVMRMSKNIEQTLEARPE